MKQNNFAIMHIIAACMVILGHMYVLLGVTVPVILSVQIHNMGVNILFIISGFLVSGSVSRSSSIKKYYAKRLLRLYPALIACLVVTTIICFFVSTDKSMTYVGEAFFYVLYNIGMCPRFILPGVFVNNPYIYNVNGSLWTLPIELALFLILPLIMFILSKVKKGRFILCFGVATVFSIGAICYDNFCSTTQILFWGTNWLNALRLVAYFLYGVSFSYLTKEQLSKFCHADLASLLLFIALCFDNYFPPEINYYILPYIVISYAFCKPSILTDFFNKHDYAYGLYLWSFPIQQILINALYNKYDIPVLVYFIMTLIVSTLTAALTHRLIETPIRDFSQRHFSQSTNKSKIA